MSRDYAESLLHTGVIEAKAGEKGAARRYLERAIHMSGDHGVLSEAWYWLGKITDDPAEKRLALENCLSFDLRHARARRELAILDGKLDLGEIINPDALPAASTSPANALADRFMCPQCGAKMVFTAGGTSLVCEHCTRTQSLPSQGETKEQDFLIAMATARGHGRPVATQVFHCQGCGAEFILPPGSISTSCAYCDSPHVVSLVHSRELLPPDGTIPFVIQQNQATRLLIGWVEQNEMKPQGIVDQPRGVYLPIWTFDIGGAIGYCGDRYETDEGFGGGSQKVVRVDGEYPVHMNDLPVPASKKAAMHLARLLPGFELKAVCTYDPRYLVNWAAEVYDIPMAEASLQARSHAYSFFKRRLPREIASLSNLKTASAGLVIESYKLVLVPVWISELPLDGKTCMVLINGQNGMLQADLPDPSSPRSQNGLFGWLADLLDG